jgi:hypothetical protein
MSYFPSGVFILRAFFSGARNPDACRDFNYVESQPLYFSVFVQASGFPASFFQFKSSKKENPAEKVTGKESKSDPAMGMVI